MHIGEPSERRRKCFRRGLYAAPTRLRRTATTMSVQQHRPGRFRTVRIAQLAPPFERVPPACYGGTERVVHALTEELVRRGHDVTLFASGDSTTSARLVPTVPVALWHDR